MINWWVPCFHAVAGKHAYAESGEGMAPATQLGQSTRALSRLLIRIDALRMPMLEFFDHAEHVIAPLLEQAE